MSGLGEAFRTAREAQGLSLADIAQRTHIRTAYLSAIEFEDWKTIGPPVYIRGFLRNYARCLGLDADAAVANFSATPAGKAPLAPPPFNAAPRNAAPRAALPRGETLAPPGRTPTTDAPKRGLSIGAIAGLIVALGLVAFVGYEYFDMKVTEPAAVGASHAGPGVDASAQSATADASPLPAAGAVGGSAQPQAAPTELRAGVDVRASAMPASHDGAELTTSPFALRLGDSSWVRVTVDGKVAMLGTFPKGTVRTFSGRSATIRAGNAGGVELWVDGKNLGPMGGLGDVAERSFRL
jgi:cytoskeleton protein RodZ